LAAAALGCVYLSCRQQKVDVTITTMRSGVVRVEDSEESLYASIDLVADKIARKLKKVSSCRKRELSSAFQLLRHSCRDCAADHRRLLITLVNIFACC
jgi:ribosome-associated translation inhibitor RaiA